MELQAAIATYEAREKAFLKDHLREWVMICDEEVLGFFSDFQAAADKYAKVYDGRPILIRRIGWEPQAVHGVEFATIQ